MLAILLAATLTGSSCAVPSIVSVGVQSATTNGAIKHYVVAVKVENEGSARQPGNLLQSVDVFQAHTKVDQIGLQPLAPKRGETVTYAFDRSAEAGDGTTNLTFEIDTNGRAGAQVDCRTGNETYEIAV